MKNSEKLPTYWLVGAAYGGVDDQLSRFISEGIWEHGFKDKYLDLVQSMKPGDRIAIKSTYTRKHDLPFDNRGKTVSVMTIKAIGTITKNFNDGHKVKVDWKPFDSPKEWYFYTYRGTIWKILPNNWMNEALIDFTFNDKLQDIKKFRNAPFWKERFGDIDDEHKRFQWTNFYEEFANKLLLYKNKRNVLVKGLYEISQRVDRMTNFIDKYPDGSSGFIKDICPFTIMGTFNRGLKKENRKIIATELASLLEVKYPIPNSFEGTPSLNKQRSWFFLFSKSRQPNDIDLLWQVFEDAIKLAEADTYENRSSFINSFDNALTVKGVKWNITFGLYWIRPWKYLPLDQNSREFISKNLNKEIERNGPNNLCSGNDYLSMLDFFEEQFLKDDFLVHSYPELSYVAWRNKVSPGLIQSPPPPGEDDDPDFEDDISGYSIDDIISDGCFIEKSELENILNRLKAKKNLILQGPPGTGKTWLAKRLAYSLIGHCDPSRVRSVQFHPNLSYEDFVRGWRPTGEGKLKLIDGPFLQMINEALDYPKKDFVLVIEEINRGNPAQIFGEMLTLLEEDKRYDTEAIELCYRLKDGERVFIPENLYVIGTMNIADRSLALVDFAFRRRFAFIDLYPRLGKIWREWVSTQYDIELTFLEKIENRIKTLNEEITNDLNLGRQFCIGHSFVIPNTKITKVEEWYTEIVQTEIIPLLEEYWFDNPEKVINAKQKLLEGFNGQK